MKAKSIKGISPEEIKLELAQSLIDGFKPTLAIVFISIKQNHINLCSILDDAGIAVFGASTNGEFIDEDTMSGSIAILLLDMNQLISLFFSMNSPKKTIVKLPVKLPKNH